MPQNLHHPPLSMAASSSSSASKSLFQSLKKFFKKPWEITGPCADPEYRNPIPKATEYRLFCPATPHANACIPTSEPETVFDIKYYTRDRRRDRPPVRRTLLKKADVEKMMKEKKGFDVTEFPRVYLTETVEEDYNAKGGGYQK
ncbi:furry [Tasmannia lanceolata]|uniref:furry n=1 Tax=Tasmannia lanceolata TaxID=3420 RepID=UPI0040645B14